MSAWIAVALGGAIGSAARHGVNRLVHQHWPLARFPWATLTVNVAGCLIIGLLAGLVAAGRLPMRASWREFIFVGILGGFTTFSTFGLDTLVLMQTGETAEAVSNVAMHVAFGLGSVYVGLLIGEQFVVGG
jgi:fluoride exporter